MDGWEVVEQLRQMDVFRYTPIIAVTAHVTHHEEERARAAGCSTHIGKPFTPHLFLETIRSILNVN